MRGRARWRGDDVEDDTVWNMSTTGDTSQFVKETKKMDEATVRTIGRILGANERCRYSITIKKWG